VWKLEKETMDLIVMRGALGLKGVYVDIEFLHVNPATVFTILEAI
jgi:hypothetical protein